LTLSFVWWANPKGVCLGLAVPGIPRLPAWAGAAAVWRFEHAH
jgi:hypothetical protein